eukprot:CAMPEP_0195525224 /NCGR_PEP_ID=MMETSP0794_2-20130614/25550_1 /TAXON_ID=515487 /ORGANISM="Stephanopyxis turris, Strain CCMP 815" /LENGTH=151 /DNA_ID=CAMNT_0040655633 /DNA_START=95 /DNA_END=550 /DNA_ORIENTATION=+
MELTQAQIDACRDSFAAYDKDHSGTIDAWELRQVLESMGQKPTDEEVFNLISTVDEDMSQTIDFPEFLTVIKRQMIEAERSKDESDILDAYIACGGNDDKSGAVHRDMLVQIIKGDFGLPIDIESLINKVDTSANGEIEYNEFKALLQGNL